MRDGLFIHLAISNLRRGRVFQLPYFLSQAGCVMAMYLMLTLSSDPAIQKMPGSQDVRLTLVLGSIVIAIFSAIILLYTSGVTVKQRKHEFGLYNVLGMEKRHIARMLRWESLFCGSAAILTGLVAGIVFSKLLQLLLLTLIGGEIGFSMCIDARSMLTTAILFAGMFLLLYFRTAFTVRLSDPIRLLNGTNEGEREPRSNWITAILGFLTMGAGYALSISTQNAVDALLFFFIAVLLVIAGTYLLFTSGSIVILKLLRRSKRYYYRINHFATVSGMIYRMRRNAAGLAGICILSTMVLVTVSSTVSLYVGMKDVAVQRFPYDVTMEYQSEDEAALADDIRAVHGILTEQGIGATKEVSYPLLTFAAVRGGENTLMAREERKNYLSAEDAVYVWMTSIEGYRSLTGKDVTLSPGEILVCTEGYNLSDGTLSLLGTDYRVRQTDLFIDDDIYSMVNGGVDSIGIVVDSPEILSQTETAQAAAYGENASSLRLLFRFNMSGKDAEKETCATAIIRETLKENHAVRVESRQLAFKEDYIPAYGAFFFLGMFLGITFVLATVLIIYYKQVSEGFDDRRRFIIMQKVGMTHKEVRKTVHSQVLTVFFLPLLTAIAHTFAAFPMIRSILSAFGMTNVHLFLLCLLITAAVFALLYVLVYLATATTYTHIVSRTDAEV